MPKLTFQPGLKFECDYMSQRSRGSSGIKAIKSVENHIRCFANFTFINQTTWPFEELDQLAEVYISSVGNVFWRIDINVARERFSFCFNILLATAVLKSWK